MTRILQPLHVALNKPLKDLLREMYVQACIKAKNIYRENKKGSNNRMDKGSLV